MFLLFCLSSAEHLAEDDSDMLMEPNDFEPSFGNIGAASRHEFYPAGGSGSDETTGDGSPIDDSEFRPALVDTTDFDRRPPPPPSQRHRAPPASPPQRSVLRSNRKPNVYDITTPSAQSFLPSFFRDTVPPLGHSRPYFSPPPPASANSVRSLPPAALPPSIAPPAYDQTILGSGDFGVIRGGTFYQENDPPVRTLESNDYFHFYKNNGHGRPQAAAYTSGGGGGGSSAQRGAFNGYPGEEQFSNFRDFADINAPSDPAYSQFVVVYANKNATAVPMAAAAEAAVDGSDHRAEALPERYDATANTAGVVSPQHRRPQNIFEQLEMLDREQPERYEVKVAKPLKPKSFKAKLARTKLEKTYTKKPITLTGPKDMDYEPLMALS